MIGTFARRLVIGVMAALGALIVGPVAGADDAPPLRVVATTTMIADAARAVGGDGARVEALMGPGVDPHAYRPTRTDVAALADADLVLWHGLYLEAQLEDLLRELGAGGGAVAVAEALPVERLRPHDEDAALYDPHVWMDPDLWIMVVDVVRAAMTDARPDDAARFAANAAVYAEEIQAVAAYARAVLASVPEERRVLVTAHDAFGYFGAAFDFEVRGVQGVSTESEAGLHRIEMLVDLLVAHGVPAVFVETSVADRNIRALIEGAAAEGADVALGGALFSDSLGAAGTYEGGFIGMFDHNATVIARALGGAAPPGGAAGRLEAAG